LKNYYRKANKNFIFQLIKPIKGSQKCFSHYGDALESAILNEYDILYLDPPYNGRNYSRYYHLPETIAHCKEYKLRGKSGMPDRCFVSSDFYHSDRALAYLQSIINSSRFKLLVLHYHDDGLISPGKVQSLLSEFRMVEEKIINSKGYSNEEGKRYAKHHLYIVINN
jgi:adenine-specific DNA-methyltransferase